MNLRSKIGDIKNLIRIWTPRFLTPIGKSEIKFTGDLLNPPVQMESREGIITPWCISCNFLEYEQLRFRFQNFMRHHINGILFIQPCLPFLIQILNLYLKGCAHFYESIKKANRNILFQIKAKWEECLNDIVIFDQMKILL